MVNEKLRQQIMGGCLQAYKRHMAGMCNGYYIIIEPGERKYNVKVNAYHPQDERNVYAYNFLNQMQAQNRNIMQVQTGTHYITIMVMAPNRNKNLPDIINAIMGPFLNYLSTNGYKTGCQECGGEVTKYNQYDINGAHHYLCNSCVATVDKTLKITQEKIRAQKSNIVLGIIGAILGAMIGGVAWVLVRKAGYIASIVGVITIVCALKGYELLGKHLNRLGVIISSVVSVAMIYFANRISYAWMFYEEMKEYGGSYSFFEAYSDVITVLKLGENMGPYYQDLIVGLLFTGVGAIGIIIAAFKESGFDYKIKKVN